MAIYDKMELGCETRRDSLYPFLILFHVVPVVERRSQDPKLVYITVGIPTAMQTTIRGRSLNHFRHHVPVRAQLVGGFSAQSTILENPFYRLHVPEKSKVIILVLTSQGFQEITFPLVS